MNDLMDIFSNPAPSNDAVQSNNFDDIFGASSNKPLAPSGQVPVGDSMSVLGQFYTQQQPPAANHFGGAGQRSGLGGQDPFSAQEQSN